MASGKGALVADSTFLVLSAKTREIQGSSGVASGQGASAFVANSWVLGLLWVARNPSNPGVPRHGFWKRSVCGKFEGGIPPI